MNSVNIPITLWNEQIESTEEGFYEIHNIRLRQFKGVKYLSSARDTVFNKLTENLPEISEKQIKRAKDELKTNEITCDNIQNVNIIVFYNCVTCSKKVQFQQNSPMLRCMNCNSRFLIKNSTKTTTACISVKEGDQTTWYSLFTSILKGLLKSITKITVAVNSSSTVAQTLYSALLLLDFFVVNRSSAPLYF